jgi:glycosyltransferase involved in cell wall biosynthesis
MLTLLGYDVTVICSTFSELTKASAENLSASGSVSGIRFWYAGGSTTRAPSFMRRRLVSAKGWSRLIRAVLAERPALVLSYPMTPLASAFLLPLTHMVGGLFLCDASELPEAHAGTGVRGSLHLAANTSGFRRSDGVVVISDSLVRRFESQIGARRLMLMPVVIDGQEFLTQDGPATRAKTTVFYSGRLNERKDGVGTLLEAFGIIHERRTDARLVLVGESDPSVVDEFRVRADALGIADAVEFRGVISREAMLDEMRSAAALVTARPDTPQNRANMPTKLIEYLATGTPVVATAVGNASEVVVNRETGLLVDPGNPGALAAAVLWVFDNEREARLIGQAGRESALSRFDQRRHVDALGEFIASLRTPK